MSQQVNLFNPAFLKQKRHFSAVMMLQGLAVILLGSIMIAGYAHWQLAGLEVNAIETEGQLKSVRAQLAKVSTEYASRQKSKALEEEILHTEAEMKARRRAFDLLQHGDTGMSKGHVEYLRAFSRQIVNGLWLTGFAIDGDNIELHGRTLQPDLLPAFINRLKQEPAMRGKSFAALSMATPEAEPMRSEATSDSLASKQRVVAGYIEFALRSSDNPPEQLSATGVTVSAVK